jgi:hypothetical protein
MSISLFWMKKLKQGKEALIIHNNPKNRAKISKNSTVWYQKKAQGIFGFFQIGGQVHGKSFLERGHH